MLRDTQVPVAAVKSLTVHLLHGNPFKSNPHIDDGEL